MLFIASCLLVFYVGILPGLLLAKRVFPTQNMIERCTLSFMLSLSIIPITAFASALVFKTTVTFILLIIVATVINILLVTTLFIRKKSTSEKT